MRFMQIEAKVRLKNFEHIVDLIEQDGGEVRVANYEGNGKAQPAAARKRRTTVTASHVRRAKALLENSDLSYKAIGKKIGLSPSTVGRIAGGVFDE